MIQADIFSWQPPAPETIKGDRHGETFDRERDAKRLNAQAQRIWNCMVDGKWRSLAEIAAVTGDREASISARLRDFRKPCYGFSRETMESVYVSRGLWRYKLHIDGRSV